MDINENTRIIDLKVSDLLIILKESTPIPPLSPVISNDDDKIGGYEVAEETTGYARQTLYQLKSSGNIPYISLPNGGVRFSKKALINWLVSHKKLSKSEVSEKANDLILKRKLRRR